MAPLPPVPQTIRLQLKHTRGSDVDVLDRLYLQYAGEPPTVADLNTFCAAVGGFWGSDLAPMAHPTVELTEVLAQDLSSDVGAEGSNGETTFGTRAGGDLPADICSLINFEVARRYRGGKPRIYLPYGTDTDVLDPQHWTAAFTAALSAAWGSFIDSVLAAAWSGGGPLVQYSVSYYLGSTELTTGVPPYVRGHTIPTKRAAPMSYLITDYTVNPVFGSQRRRVRKR